MPQHRGKQGARMYTCTHAHMHTRTHAHVCTRNSICLHEFRTCDTLPQPSVKHVHTCTHAHMHACTRAYVHAQHTCSHARTHAHNHAPHVRPYARACPELHVCICMRRHPKSHCLTQTCRTKTLQSYGPNVTSHLPPNSNQQARTQPLP